MQQPTSPHRFVGRPSRRHGVAGADSERVVDLGRLLIGAAVIALGVLFLLDSADTLDAGRAIDRWWPAVIVAGGVLTLLERPPALVRGALLTGVGIVLLLFTTDVLEENAWSYVWPALLIIVGIVIVARWSGRTISGVENEEDVVRATGVFGGPNLVCGSQRFRGAWLTAIFGGVTLDLRDARPAPEGASINATAAFGGIEIIVPRGWRVSVRSTPIFGGLDDKTEHTPPPPEDAPALHIDAVSIFGGVEIKHHK